ncbi:MAG: hypothetical protein IPK26_20025 [Planctomycetes bacterium]|nr:hypothetical protein [Planctomycetota bacterium]
MLNHAFRSVWIAACVAIPQVAAQQRIPLTAADAMAGDTFGSSVAIAAGTVLVGAPGADPALIRNAGAAYVFVLAGATATQQARLTAADASLDAQFGNRVAIAGDVAVVGAWYDDPIPGGTDAGSVYVFARLGTIWVQQQKLLAGDVQARAHFGASLAFDGSRIAVGAPDCDQGRGAVYMFELAGGTWVQMQKLAANQLAPKDRFGSSVAISNATLAVGASQRDVVGLSDAGMYSVFLRHTNGTWSEHQQRTLGRNRYQGRSIALSGSSLLVGRSGGADGYSYVPASTPADWLLNQEFSALGLNEVLLENLAVSDCTAVTGAPSSNWVDVHRRAESSKFARTARLTNDVGQGAGWFGFSVALDLLDIAVGAPKNDLPGKTDAGMAYVFRSPGSSQVTWNQSHAGGSGAPPGREQFAMASDTRRGRVVLFGGANSVDLADTWEWNGTQWQQLSPVTSPSARHGHAMVFDNGRGRVVLYGGQNPSAPNGLDDMWQWDGSNWTPVSNIGPARGAIVAGTMAWDLHRSRAVLFGGAGSGESNDTWEWESTGATTGRWFRHPTATTTHPGFRFYHATTYDQARRVTLIHGGRDRGGIPYGETWAWNGSVWRLVDANGPTQSNSAWIYHAMAYDVATSKVVMNLPGMPFTWTWDGQQWTQIVADNGPRMRSAMAWDSVHNKVIMFGGANENIGGVYLNDVWSWCSCGN